MPVAGTEWRGRRLLTIAGLWAGLMLAAFASSPASAEATQSPLRVATFLLPPYVMREHNQLTGFSIDLWNAVAQTMNVKTDYFLEPDVNAVFAAVQSNNTDVGVSGIYITAAREDHADFSVPILNAGMQVMVRESGGVARRNSLIAFVDLVFSITTLEWLGIALLFMVVPAHLIWLLERRRNEGIITDNHYIPGIVDAMHWAATTLLSQADRTPRRLLSRIVSFVWMFVGIAFLALYTAQLTASLTVEKIGADINGPDDLPGKRVATLQASTSAEYLQEHGLPVQAFPEDAEMFKALLDGQVDAVLFSAPTLHYFASHAGSGKVRMVGPEFHNMDLGFVVPVDSPHRRAINAALLTLRENGAYARIYDKWFGRNW